MRITVGGILLLAGVVGVTAYFALDPSRISGVGEKVHGVMNGTMSLVGLFKSGSGGTAAPYSPPPPFPAGSVGTVDSSTTNTVVALAPASVGPVPVPVAATPVPYLPAATPVPTPTPSPQKLPVKKRHHRGSISIQTGKNAIESGSTENNAASPAEMTTAPTPMATPTPAHRKKHIHKKSHKHPKPGVKKAAAPQVSKASASPNSDLMGTYVSLDLVTGRAVQGILEGKTATHYILNVPGLGPLEYPVENVKSVKPAQ